MTMKNGKKDYGKLVKVLQIATGVLMLVLVGAAIYLIQKYDIKVSNIKNLSLILNERFGNGVMILSAVMIGISVIKSFALVFPPAVVFSITAYILPENPLLAFAVNFTGMVLSLVVPYFLGRFTGAGMVDTLSGKFKAIKKIDDFAGTNEFSLTAVFKFAGILPGDLSSLLFGAMNISFRNYMLGCIVGNLPLVIVYTAFGTVLKNVGEKPWVVAIPVVVIVLFLLIASLITKRMISKSKARNASG